jgi:hypothetical protein
MAYIGRQPLVVTYQVLDAIVATTTDTYALTKDAVAVFPQTPSNCIVSLNGVIQAPTDSYTISGSDIVFASALTGTDSIDFITVLGDVLSIGTPTDGTVTTAKLVDSSVTTAKLNDGSVSLAKLTATGTQDATTFLRGDNTFASAGGANTPSFLTYVTSDFSVANATWTTIGFDNSIVNNGSAFNTGTYRFTCPSDKAGLYSFSAGIQMETFASGNTIELIIELNDAGKYQSRVSDILSASQTIKKITTLIVNLAVGDYVDVKVYQNTGGARSVAANSAYFGGYKLID